MSFKHIITFKLQSNMNYHIKGLNSNPPILLIEIFLEINPIHPTEKIYSDIAGRGLKGLLYLNFYLDVDFLFMRF